MECKLPGRYIDDSAIDLPGWVHILLELHLKRKKCRVERVTIEVGTYGMNSRS